MEVSVYGSRVFTEAWREAQQRRQDEDETDDLGLWVKIEREGSEHLLLVRWEYVLSIDVEVTERKGLGFQR
ncbi:MAG: hypothetical protein DMG24_21725 [Acidobacteria bacterium]|nr:MAG: hypothetical protein DMG24_21725 [Acidobacteriota bacterium]